jgi:hypothetical protein
MSSNIRPGECQIVITGKPCGHSLPALAGWRGNDVFEEDGDGHGERVEEDRSWLELTPVFVEWLHEGVHPIGLEPRQAAIRHGEP